MKKILFFVLLSVFYVSASAQTGGYAVGETVDNFTVTTTQGVEVTLYDLTSQGKYVFLDFFFDTCGPCQGANPLFNEFHEKYGCNSGDVYCISINNGTDSDAEVIAYESSFGGAYNHVPAVSADGGAGAVDATFIIGAYPTICLIGPDNTLKNGDIWPLADYTTFSNALAAAGSNAVEIACSTASVDEFAVTSEMSIFPNPATDVVTIDLNINSNQVLTITNLVGQVIYSERIYAAQQRTLVAVEKFEDGIYIIQLEDVATGEFITEKVQIIK